MPAGDHLDRLVSRFAEKLDSISEMINYVSDLRGVDDETSLALAAAVKTEVVKMLEDEVQSTRHECSGQRVTIRQLDPRAEIKQKVRAAFTGNNVKELTERFGISRRTVYNYLKN